jgi:hypothetical protein
MARFNMRTMDGTSLHPLTHAPGHLYMIPSLVLLVILLADEAIDAGVPVAVCSTSNERAVSTIVRVMLGDAVAAKMVRRLGRWNI